MAPYVQPTTDQLLRLFCNKACILLFTLSEEKNTYILPVMCNTDNISICKFIFTV